MSALKKETIKRQVENLTRYIITHPSENLRVFCSTVQTAGGEAIAHFNNHIQAVTAVRSIRESLQTAVS